MAMQVRWRRIAREDRGRRNGEERVDGKEGISWKSDCGHEHGTAALTVFYQAAIPRAAMGSEGEGGKQRVEQQMCSVRFDWLRRFHPLSLLSHGCGARRLRGDWQVRHTDQERHHGLLEVYSTQPAESQVPLIVRRGDGTWDMIYADMGGHDAICLFV